MGVCHGPTYRSPLNFTPSASSGVLLVTRGALPPAAGHGGLALRTADVLALHLVAVDQHDAAATARLVPGLAAPAAVPAPVLRLEWTACCQRATRRQRR